MAKTNAIRAARAFVELFADDSKLVRGLRSAEKKLRAFGNSIRNIGLKMAGLGAAVAAPLVAATKSFAKMGDDVAKMSARTGVSVEALSELGFAAEQSGADIPTLENSLRRMQRTIYDAGRGLSTATDALKDLGLTTADLEGLSPEQQFKLLADQLSKIEDPTTRAALAMGIFGRSGTKLLPMLADGAAGIEALQEEARRLGLTMSTEDAKAAEVFTDALNRMRRVVRMGVFRIGAALTPVIQQVTERITRAAVVIGDWIKQNRQLIVTVLKVAAAVVAGGIALVVLGTIISGVAAVLGKLAAVVVMVGSVIKVLVGIIAMILSPIGLVIGAVAALGAYLVYATGIGGKALAWLGTRFEKLRDIASDVFGGIADALQAGDIALAAKILWLSLRLAWVKGTDTLLGVWSKFRDFFLDIFDNFTFGGQVLWAEFVGGIQRAWAHMVAGLTKAWATFSSWHQGAVEKTGNWIAKKWVWLQSKFDDTIDVEFMTRHIDEQSAQRFAEIDSDRDAALAQADASRDEAINHANEARDKRLAEIGKADAETQRRRADAHAQQLADSESELAKARAELEDAIESARRKRHERDADTGPDELGAPDELKNIFDNLGHLFEQARAATMGTFSGAAAERLGSAGPADRTANATEEIARNTKRMLDEMRTGGAAFE